MLFVTLLAILAATLPSPVDTIVVGHSSLRGVSLALGTDTTEVFVVQNGSRRLVTTATLSVARTGATYVVVFVGKVKGGEAIDSVVLSAATLAPLRHVEVMPDHHATFVFDNGRVTGTSDSAGVTTPIDLSIGVERFDFSVLQQVMDQLPLAQGYSAVVLSYDVATRKERAVNLRVVGKESLEVDGATVEAWKTVVDFGTHQVTRWIAVSGRRELRWEISRPGMRMEGRTKRE
jgi:hypothetical protein